MRRTTAVTALLAALLAPTTAGARGETRAQTQHRLTVSEALWATVNVCDTRRHPNAIGVRVSMPGTFANGKELMYARLQVQYLSTRKKTHGWRDLGRATGWFLLGNARQSSRQSGMTFRFKPQGFRFRARADFRWRFRGRARYRASEYTSGGHRDAAGADPPHESRPTCVIGRRTGAGRS